MARAKHLFFFRKRRVILAFIFGWLATFLLSFGLVWEKVNLPAKAESVSLTVSAAASLKDALEELKNIARSEGHNFNIAYNFGSSGSLQQQISQGAPVDVFISAASKQMDTLEQENLLLPGSRQNLLTNQLVLIAPKDEQTIKSFDDLSSDRVGRIALGEPNSVPAGQYAQEVLNYYNLLDSVKSKLIYAKDVRQVLSYVETGNVDAGFVYLSDTKQSQQVTIVATAPSESHSPIIYPIAILKESKNPQTAQEFSQFLTSPQAKNIFEQYGFSFYQQ
jgi:molybdate transport system substrate-binding protein